MTTKRIKLLAIASAALAAVAALAVVIAWLILEGFGWRIYSLVAGVIALLLSAPQVVVPESIRFFVASSKSDEAGSS